MKSHFFKYPSTPHLANLSDLEMRNDKVMSKYERDAFLSRKIIVEEKIDGANLGISFDCSGELQLQNRGEYLQAPFSGQWNNLKNWLESKVNILFEEIQDQYIIFGEWCYAQHTVAYDNLPDWFLGFDVLCKANKRFFSYERRNALFKRASIVPVPLITEGTFSFEEIVALLGASKVGSELSEGVYLRSDEKEWLLKRAKLVRPEFVQTMETHWSSKEIKPNKLYFFNAKMH